MNAKRSLLLLAAVLTATVLTGGAAILGLVQRPAPPAPAPAALVQQMPAAQTWHEGGD